MADTPPTELQGLLDDRDRLLSSYRSVNSNHYLIKALLASDWVWCSSRKKPIKMKIYVTNVDH